MVVAITKVIAGSTPKLQRALPSQGVGKSSVIDARRLNFLLKERDLSQSELARRVGISQAAINKLASGKGQGSKHLHKIAEELGTTPGYLTGTSDIFEPPEGTRAFELHHQFETAERAFSAPSSISADRILEIPVIDLAYGLGGTFLGDVEPEARSEPFPLSFIRRYTKAKAEDLFVADGLGDSMAPTIGSNDQMLIDRSIDSIRVADQIWAFSFGGVGMVKRLRPRPDGSVAILSDNPAVSDDRAVDDELFIIGRVVAIVRKV